MATEAKVAPALTAEEWREFLHSERKTPLPADQIAAYMDASGATEEEARHAFLHDAAVHLHLAGPFFTRGHVEAARSAARVWEAMHDTPGEYFYDDAHAYEQYTTLYNLAELLEALLPPEE